jgi:hypothetical protein
MRIWGKRRLISPAGRGTVVAMSDTRNPRYGTIDGEYGLRLAGTSAEDDGPIWMVNLMRYREFADYADGRLQVRRKILRSIGDVS